VPLGDGPPHPARLGDCPEDGYVPLHKLSQWLAAAGRRIACKMRADGGPPFHVVSDGTVF